VAYADLREFVKRLEKEGELKRIRAEVDPILEIAEVTQRVCRPRTGDEEKSRLEAGGTKNKALLLRNRRDRGIHC